MDEDTFFKTKRQVIEYIDNRTIYLKGLPHNKAIDSRIGELETLRKYIRNVMLFKKEDTNEN